MSTANNAKLTIDIRDTASSSIFLLIVSSSYVGFFISYHNFLIVLAVSPVHFNCRE